jgi:hypothetical protein
MRYNIFILIETFLCNVAVQLNGRIASVVVAVAVVEVEERVPH